MLYAVCCEAWSPEGRTINLRIWFACKETIQQKKLQIVQNKLFRFKDWHFHFPKASKHRNSKSSIQQKKNMIKLYQSTHNYSASIRNFTFQSHCSISNSALYRQVYIAISKTQQTLLKNSAKRKQRLKNKKKYQEQQRTLSQKAP